MDQNTMGWSPIISPALAHQQARQPRFRLTTRRLMIGIAIVALGLFLLRQAMWVVDSLDEPFYVSSTITRSWDLGPTPTIFVDCFEGQIWVAPSTDGRVTAEVRSGVLAQDYREAAAAGLKTIDVDFAQHGDTLRIVARGASEGYDVRKEADVNLFVPANVRLDLRTGRGDIHVGEVLKGSVSQLAPIVALSIRARNDSKHGSHPLSEGRIMVATMASRAADVPPTPTRLQLDAPGRIDIVADLAEVEAYAWHGVTPPGWTPADYEDGQEGTITFDGTLAKGQHTFRAAHGLLLRVPTSIPLQVDARAMNGNFLGSLLPGTVEPVRGTANWSGSTGEQPQVAVDLQADDGWIRLDGKP